MAYPTTLALITALWAPGPAGPSRSRCGRPSAARSRRSGPLIAGILLQHYWWGSVFLVVLPLIVIGLPLAIRLIPAHVNETTESVDNVGGILSVGARRHADPRDQLRRGPRQGHVRDRAGVHRGRRARRFLIRQRRAENPLYDLDIANRPIFWVAAVAGIIVFGSLMGAMFIGQQFLQNVLDYSTVEAGRAILPAAIVMVLLAPRSAKLVESHGARFTLLFGYVFCLLGFVWMLVSGKRASRTGMSGSPTRHRCRRGARGNAGISIAHRRGAGATRRYGLGHRRPPARSRWGDHAVDLRCAAHRRVRGIVPQADRRRSEREQVSTRCRGQLTKSFSSAENTAQQYPQYASQIIKAGADSRSSTVRTGPISRASSRCCWGW